MGRLLISETPGYQQPCHTPEDLLENWSAVMDRRGAYQCADAVESNRQRRMQILAGGEP